MGTLQRGTECVEGRTEGERDEFDVKEKCGLLGGKNKTIALV